MLPSALPLIFTGLRLSLGVGWMVLIAAEMLAQNPGLGKFVWDEFQNGSSSSLARIMVAVLTIGIIGFAARPHDVRAAVGLHLPAQPVRRHMSFLEHHRTVARATARARRRTEVLADINLSVDGGRVHRHRRLLRHRARRR